MVESLFFHSILIRLAGNVLIDRCRVRYVLDYPDRAAGNEVVIVKTSIERLNLCRDTDRKPSRRGDTLTQERLGWREAAARDSAPHIRY